MKKVLSVALASAMVLGMGANAFAISYNSSTNDEASWPKNFRFEGQLFVTNKDGDIVEDASTDLTDNKNVDFEPGDVIWMPLYADHQKVYQGPPEHPSGGSDRHHTGTGRAGGRRRTEGGCGRPVAGHPSKHRLISRKIDTFETSILPYEDCCTVFTPKHPRTKPQLKFVKYAEEQMDSEQLIQRAIDGIELLSISNS